MRAKTAPARRVKGCVRDGGESGVSEDEVGCATQERGKRTPTAFLVRASEDWVGSEE